MGNDSREVNHRERFTLRVDDKGRVTLPKVVRDRLGIESNDKIPAALIGTILEFKPKPSTKLETATTGRDSWENTTPTDTAETLFGPMER